MEFKYLEFVLYVAGVLAIPAVAWWAILRTERKSIEKSRRQGEELMGGPYVKRVL